MAGDFLKSLIQKNLDFYEENYDITSIELKTEDIRNNDKKYIGKKEKRGCRFCMNVEGDTTFKKIAHAIPELIGNKVFISYEECDECNKLFSKFENELANYLSFDRTTTGIKGKKGVPTYKNNSGLRIESVKSKKNRYFIQGNKSNVEEDPINKTFSVNGIINPYVPVSVYKCFVKMALSIIPIEQIPNFVNTIIWISKENIFKEEVKCVMHEQFIPGTKPFKNIDIKLAFRKQTSLKISPYCIFMICFGNSCYQIYLPLAIPDAMDGLEKDFKFPLFPSKYSLEFPDEPIQSGIKDFSSNQRVIGEESGITYSYGEKIMLPKENIDFLKNGVIDPYNLE
ncbi:MULTISPECIES: HNH endonuclease [Bacillati]|uniref:HNH endonuclease n=1 Tax=Bacillati TaxID=1783272 RepID=UPI00342E5F28